MTVDSAGDQRARLRTLLITDSVISVGGTLFALLVYLTAFDDVYMLVLGGFSLTAAVCMAVAVLVLDRGDVSSALLLFAAGNWQAALGVALVGVFAWPLMLLAAVLPAIVVVPHADRGETRRYVIGSLGIALAVTLVGNLQDFSGLSEDAPEWATALVVAFFAPFLSVLIVLTAWQNSTRLQEALDAEVAANQGLEESRRRVVAATDSERRRIERDLHDGAQQRLVAMSMRVKTGLDQTGEDAPATEVLRDLQSDVRDLQRELRDLIRGIYPPALTQHGLPAALRAVSANGAGEVDLDLAPVSRQESEIEAAVYFSCVEALQNAAKHGGGPARTSLQLSEDTNELRFEVRDNGPGFDPEAVDAGRGLQNIVDRMEAVGGGVCIESGGSGTIVRGWVPASTTA